MKVSLNWLRGFIDIDIDLDDLADRLTLQGLAVDGIEHVTVIRGDDMAEVMAQVKELTALVKQGREKETTPTEDIPFCDKHGAHFERHSNERGAWFSHKTANGWCRYQPAKG